MRRSSFRHLRWVLAFILLDLLACSERSAPGPEGARVTPSFEPAFSSRAVLRERSGLGRLAYLGFDAAPARPERGRPLELTHYFRVERPAGAEYDIFVHGDTPGGGPRIFAADHAPPPSSSGGWKAGDVWSHRHRVAIPTDYAAPTLELYVGLFKGDLRWTVEAPPGGQDGTDRIRAGTLVLGGALPKDDLPIATIVRATSTITPDGVLDEPDWARAEVLTLSDSMGRPEAPRFPTKLRLLYDSTNLYVAFDSVDQDITERYAKRDDPIYEHEAVELFLMPNVIAPAVGPYVELQASPGGVIFDAAFTGRRQGMDTKFDAQQTVGTRIDGTLDVAGDVDRGWVSEWVVPWRAIRGVSAPPSPGDEWRMNAFRIENFRAGNTLQGEYTAWSPPRVGDFHNLARFGRMRFAP
jgi:hypothetical protein